jgi:hypothetical protein
VIPTAGEQESNRMVIASVPGLRHDDMWDGASEPRKAAVLALLDRCLAG